MKCISSCEIVEHEGLSVGVVRFTETMEALSSAILNGGSTEADAMFIMQVPHDYDHDDPIAHARSVRDALGLPENTVGMMTAAEVPYVFNKQEVVFEGVPVCAIATAGLSNHVVAGDKLVDWPARHIVSLARAAKMMAGTINIALVTESPLTEAGKINMFMPLVEGKSAAMADRGFRETGTTSDAMAIFCPKHGERVGYTGTGSDIGIAAARASRAAVGYALEARGEHPVPEEPMKLLERLGYGMDAMWTLSGTPMTKDQYAESLAEYLKGEDVRTFLDLAVFASDRIDSLADDGNVTVMPMVYDICRSYLGITPDLSHGTVEGIVTAIAEDAGRKSRWDPTAPAGSRPSRA